MAWTEKQMDELVNAVKGLIDRTVDPVREHVRGIAGRADKHYQRLESLEARIAALERKQGQKARPVSLLKADD